MTFTLETSNVPEGTAVRAVLDQVNIDINPNNFTPNFVVGSDGRATLTYQIVDVRESDPVDIDFRLMDRDVAVHLWVLP